MSAGDVWRFAFSLSVAFPAIVSIICFKKVNEGYRPFLIYTIVSLINELLVGFVIVPNNKKGMNLDNNIFYLFEALILFAQFYLWKRPRPNKLYWGILAGVLTAGWIFENFVAKSIIKYNIVFAVSYSFLLVLLSVQTINYIIINEGRVSLTKNAKFIICTATIILFIYNMFVFITMNATAKNINGTVLYDKVLVSNIFAIKVYVNAFCNLLYGIAVCLIPQKKSTGELFKNFDF
ncbi:MAG TPA: hypothetical protein VMT76_12005 [Puia sp.]|nr:hypothetical protein [Puia sp.]